MARYLITASAYVEKQYFKASMQEPLAIEVSDELVPSKTWKALDEAARVALAKRLGQPVPVADEPVKPESVPGGDQMALSQLNKAVKKVR